MKTLSDIFKESESELPKYVNHKGDYDCAAHGEGLNCCLDKEEWHKKLNNFLKSHTIKLLEAECERLEGEKKLDYGKTGWQAEAIMSYNKAIQDQIYHLQEEIKKIKNI